MNRNSLDLLMRHDRWFDIIDQHLITPKECTLLFTIFYSAIILKKMQVRGKQVLILNLLGLICFLPKSQLTGKFLQLEQTDIINCFQPFLHVY